MSAGSGFSEEELKAFQDYFKETQGSNNISAFFQDEISIRKLRERDSQLRLEALKKQHKGS